MMLKGELTYLANVSGDRLVAFPSLSVKPRYPSVERIEVSASTPNDPEHRSIQVSVRFSSVPSHDEATLIGSQIAKDILDRVAFEYKISIDEPSEPESHLAIVGGDVNSLGSEQILIKTTACGRAQVVVHPDENDLAHLSKRLNAQRLKGRTYYPLLRSALKIDNPVEKYLALYRILLVIHDDEQRNLDRFLHTVFGDKLKPRPGQKKPKPGKSKIRETVFTKLRNEFSHIRKRTRLEKTREQMKQQMEPLLERVKRAIEMKG